MRDNRLYVACMVFNPRAYESRYRLYREFKARMVAAGVVLVTVEIAFQNRDFVVTSADDDHDIQLRSDAEMWHKERALNLAIHHIIRLHPTAEKIGWFDTDVQIIDPNWVKKTVDALDHFAVIQPFSQACFLTPQNTVMWECYGAMFQHYHKRGFHQEPPIPLSYIAGGHPGLAWVARRDILDKLGGVLDTCVTGSGDTHMLNALLGDWKLYTDQGMTKGYLRSIERWAEKCAEHVKGNVGFIDGAILHFWHGQSEKRGYEKRGTLVNFHKFDPYEDIQQAASGLYQWRGNKKNLEMDIRRTNIARDEDSTQLPLWYTEQQAQKLSVPDVKEK